MPETPVIAAFYPIHVKALPIPERSGAMSTPPAIATATHFIAQPCSCYIGQQRKEEILPMHIGPSFRPPVDVKTHQPATKPMRFGADPKPQDTISQKMDKLLDAIDYMNLEKKGIHFTLMGSSSPDNLVMQEQMEK